MTEQEEYQEYLEYIEYQKYLKSLKQPKSDVAGGVETGARSMLEGATAGLSEPVLSGINAVVGTGIDAAMGAGPANWEAIKQAYADDVERRKGLKAEHPTVSAAAGLAGAVLPSPINLGSKIAKGAEAIANAPKILRGAGLVKGAARGAISGAAGGAGYEAARQLAERPTGFIDSDSAIGDVLNSAVFGAKVGGGVGGALQLPGALARGKEAVKGGAKKLLSSKFGVSEGAIDEYLNNPKRVENAKSIEQLHDEIYEAVRGIQEKFNTAKLSKEQAEAELNSLVKTLEDGLKSKGADAKDALANARELFRGAVMRAKEERTAAASAVKAVEGEAKLSLQGKKLDAKEAARAAKAEAEAAQRLAQQQMAPEVVRSIDDLKNIVSQGSGTAFQVLEKSGAKFPATVFLDPINEAINGLKIGGKKGAAVGSANAAAVRSLEALRAQIKQLPKDLSASQVKKILQNMGRDIEWQGPAGSFMDAASREKAHIRAVADAALKSASPEYAAAMRPVADDTALLSEVSRALGTEQNALGAIAGAGSNSKYTASQALEALQKRLGKDFVSPTKTANLPQGKALADAEARAASMERPEWMPGELERIVAGSPEARRLAALGELDPRSLPEFGKLRQAVKVNAKMRRPEYKPEQMRRGVEGSPQQQALAKAEAGLKQAEAEFAPFKPIAPNAAGQTSIQNKLKSAISGRSIETRRMFEDLSKKTGRDFVQAIDDLRLREAFEKGDVHGSRNVNFWGAIGTGLGFLVGGGIGAVPGLGAGVAVGKYMDKYGPQTAKAILDLAIKARGLPSAADIAKWPIPKAARADLARELGDVFTPEIIEQMGKNVRALPGVVKRGAEEAEKHVAENEQSRDRMPAAKRKARLKALGE